ncbi:endonuclease [Chitinophaga sp. Mgbs1]|uniref:Endonuclease n=1 Tax=Chitinophaga solisilvae TaxID=1233460 RepID=A0A3S1CUK3_9BACT|nr:endonuclease [Chitinophaga solisilvae]
MKKTAYLLSALLAWTVSLSAQQPVYKHSFGPDKNYNTCKGIAGTALNLDKNAALRSPQALINPLKGYQGSYSVQCWVKAAPSASSYVLLTSSGEKSGRWELGVQESGAWYWQHASRRGAYQYRPTAARQSIRNNKWHQLTYCMDSAKKEVSLYYDGTQVAVYNTEDIVSTGMPDTLWAGGRPEGDLGQWNTFNGAFDELTVYREVLTPAYIRQTAGIFIPQPPVASLAAGKQLRVMNYNIWHGGNETGKDTGPERIVDVIRQSGADIISMQETYGSGEKIADALGYYFYLRSSNLSIMSRYPIEATLPGAAAFYNGGAYIRLNKNQQIAFITNWLNYPLDYWDMLEKNMPLNADTLLLQMEKTNGSQLRKNLAVNHEVIANAAAVPVIFCGDLNSGSHLDWTESTRHLNNGLVVPFPQSKIMLEAGFKDSFREIHPDPLKERGITWSPQFPHAFKDRIDYIYYTGKKLKALQSYTITEHPVHYPSDHAALVTVFGF